MIVIKIKLNEMLQKEERSLNWVSTKTGISYSTLFKLNNNDTKLISFDVLEKICLLLRCSPNDILEIEETSQNS